MCNISKYFFDNSKIGFVSTFKILLGAIGRIRYKTLKKR